MPVQAHEQLPVREALGEPVRSMYGECSLADPGHAVDCGDSNDAAVAHQIRQLPPCVFPPREGGDIGGQGMRSRDRAVHCKVLCGFLCCDPLGNITSPSPPQLG
jgi:hypothetical protein